MTLVWEIPGFLFSFSPLFNLHKTIHYYYHLPVAIFELAVKLWNVFNWFFSFISFKTILFIFWFRMHFAYFKPAGLKKSNGTCLLVGIINICNRVANFDSSLIFVGSVSLIWLSSVCSNTRKPVRNQLGVWSWPSILLGGSSLCCRMSSPNKIER